MKNIKQGTIVVDSFIVKIFGSNIDIEIYLTRQLDLSSTALRDFRDDSENGPTLLQRHHKKATMTHDNNISANPNGLLMRFLETVLA